MVRSVVAFLFLLGCSTGTVAQTIRGTVVDESTNSPLHGVFVVLLDSIGQQRGGTLSDQNGFFAMRAPAAGSFSLRAERIGHRSVTTSPFVVTESAAQSINIRVPIEAIALEPIDVSGEKRCELRREQGRRTAQLWEEARKALTVAQWLEKDRSIQFEYRSYVRELEPYSLSVRRESLKHLSSSRIPYRAVAPDLLARFGFVLSDGAETTYYGPDAEVLLSDIFLEQHCFRSVRGRGDTEALVGLAFEPVHDRHLPDITGTLWLDSTSLELRYIDFRYTNLPHRYDLKTLGGRTHFRKLPSGAWMVERWYIRMPKATMTTSGQNLRVITVHEEGGEVTSMSDARMAAKIVHDGAIRGVVYDSVRGRPLSNATVYLSGTSHRAVTDQDGNFTITDVPAGRYVIAFTHSVLDSLPALPVPGSVVVEQRDTALVALATASVNVQMAAKCGTQDPSQVGRGTAGALFGYVRDADGNPIAGAEVTVTHRRYARAASKVPFTEHNEGSRIRTDRLGRYELCLLPLEELLTVQAQFGKHSSGELKTRIEPFPFKRADFVVRLR